MYLYESVVAQLPIIYLDVEHKVSRFRDLTGRKFGKLLVVSQSKTNSGRFRVNCRCDCGTQISFEQYYVENSKKESCGKCDLSFGADDLEGKRFGKLVVTAHVRRRTGKTGNSLIYWKCVCDCGTEHWAWSWNLKAGNVKSCGCLSKLPDGECAIRNIYRSYRNKARIYNREFSISIDEFKKITSQNCNYCNCEPYKIARNKYKTGETLYNGLDRVNNNGGYTLDNIVACCERCNRAKLEMGHQEFLEWIAKVYKYSCEGKQ